MTKKKHIHEHIHHEKHMKIKTFGVLTLLAWTFGVLFIIAGAVSLINSIFGGLLILLGGVIILPPFGEFVEEKINVRLSGWLKFVLFLILVGIGLSLSTSGAGEDFDATRTRIEAEATQEVSEPEDIPTMTVKLIEKRTFVQIGEHFFDTFMGAKASGTYLVLTIEVSNNGDEPIYVTSSDIKLFDKEGRKYVTDSEAMMYLDNSFVFETINPGIKATGKVVFDVQDPNKEYDLKVYDSALSWFD